MNYNAVFELEASEKISLMFDEDGVKILASKARALYLTHDEAVTISDTLRDMSFLYQRMQERNE
jgi:hypothetical protein